MKNSTAMALVLPPVMVKRNTLLHALSVKNYDLIKGMLTKAAYRKGLH